MEKYQQHRKIAQILRRSGFPEYEPKKPGVEDGAEDPLPKKTNAGTASKRAAKRQASAEDERTSLTQPGEEAQSPKDLEQGQAQGPNADDGRDSAPGEPAEAEINVHSLEPDDLISPITIETYIEYRTEPCLMHMTLQAPRLSRLLSRV